VHANYSDRDNTALIGTYILPVDLINSQRLWVTNEHNA